MIADDLTPLMRAQKVAAWGEVARKLAHEIKNPLTPIQLSAQRLRRRLARDPGQDQRLVNECTETIIQEVDGLKRLVDEFSRFARMPKPVIAAEDVAETVRQAAFMQRVANSEIDIDVETAHEAMPARFDRRLISQALTNIIKNATEAIGAVPPAERGRGRILVRAARRRSRAAISSTAWRSCATTSWASSPTPSTS